jgi:hypothetical protein
MNSSLGKFQDAFVDALYGVDSPEITALSLQPGFAVYRNTVLKGAIDALFANFPTVERLVGTDWLKAAAAVHVRQSPPTDVRLLLYGADFPAFLDSFEHAQEMPYLGNVARLDRVWTEVHCAADEAGIDLNAFAQIFPTELENTKLTVSSAARWIWFDQQPAYTIWRINRELLDMPDDLDWLSEGALLTRKKGRVCWQAASAADLAFLDACAAGLSLGLAAEKAIEVQPDVDPSELITRLVMAHTFSAAG